MSRDILEQGSRCVKGTVAIVTPSNEPIILHWNKWGTPPEHFFHFDISVFNVIAVSSALRTHRAKFYRHNISLLRTSPVPLGSIKSLDCMHVSIDYYERKMDFHSPTNESNLWSFCHMCMLSF